MEDAKRKSMGLGSRELSTKEKFLAFKTDKSGARYMIAKELLKKWPTITLGEHTRNIYIYEDGVFILGEHILEAEIQTLLEEVATKNTKGEILSSIRDMTHQREDVLTPAHFINLKNKVYDIKNKILLDHSPDYKFFHKIPVDFDADATCPAIQKFFQETLQAKDIPVMEEWFGFCLYRNYFIKKAMIFVGEKDTGKSTLLNLLTHFIGKENTSGISLQRLSSDRFAAGEFHRKNANIFDELSADDITHNGAFKMATGNGFITGEHKFSDHFKFVNYAKLIFACNEIPSVKETNDEAYFIRWLMVKFINPPKEMDKFLLETKLAIPGELSGLLNLALRGLDRLLTAGQFSVNEDADTIKEEMMRSGSSVSRFAYDMMENPEDPNHWIAKQDLHSAYVKYCSPLKLAPDSFKKFTDNIQRYASFIADGKSGNVRLWRNIKLKNSEDEPVGKVDDEWLPSLDEEPMI